MMFSPTFFLILLLCAGYIHQIVSQDEKEVEKVTILEWQFCEGCKLTVDLYGELFHEQMSQFYKKGPKPDAMVNSSEIVSRMCDNPYFDQFQPFVKYGCIKTIDDAGVKFLQQFSGYANALDVVNKASAYRRRKEVCSIHTTACSAEVFQKANITSKARSTCKGCEFIAQEIDMFRRLFHAPKDFQALKTALKDTKLCDRFTKNYMPYNWLEWICEEMQDEHLDAIIEIFKFHDQVSATGFQPDETASQMMCREFYGCKKPKSSREL